MRRTSIVYSSLFALVFAACAAFYFAGDESSEIVTSDSSGRAVTEPMRVATVVDNNRLVETSRVAVLPVRAIVVEERESDLAIPTPLAVDYSSRRAALADLETAAQFDEYWNNRLSAVSSLRMLATGGDTDGRIREALRIATTDTDARVAEAARAAYSEVVQSSSFGR